MNTPSADSIAKKTLMMRLFVQIYAMPDAQLHRLLAVLDQKGSAGPDIPIEAPSFRVENPESAIQRHATIARLFVLIRQMDRDVLLERLKAFNHPDFHWSREFPRMDCNLLIDFVVGDKAYRGYLRDISAGGLFIVTSDRFEIDEKVSLCFTMDESDKTVAFKLTGRIKRLYNDGIAVEYQDIPQPQQSVIDAMVHKKVDV